MFDSYRNTYDASRGLTSKVIPISTRLHHQKTINHSTLKVLILFEFEVKFIYFNNCY